MPVGDLFFSEANQESTKNFARVTLEENIVSIEQQIAQRREKLAGLAAEAESLIVGRQVMSEREIETYREFLSDLPALWENADNELRNHFLHIVLQGVYVFREPTFYDVMILWYNGEQDFIRIHIPPRFWRRDKWTEEQEQYLRENYATASWHELTTVLGRKESAIKLRAFQRGLERKEKVSSGKKWSSQEEEVLERYSACELPYEEMRCALPDRNEQAIYSKMRRMGLSQPTRPHWYILPESYDSGSPSSHSKRKNKARRPARSL